jgi:3-dehydroquinate dehydratase-1
MSSPWPAPLLVGVVDRPEALARYAGTDRAARCVDLVEARVDLFEPQTRAVSHWAEASARLEASGTPVLVTARLAAEGGRWTAPDTERLPIYAEAVTVASWVDVEAQSPIAAQVTAVAHARRRTAVISHHDFTRTPPLAELTRLVDACHAVGGDIAKLATLVTGPADRDALMAVLARRPDRTCVIGMGSDEAAQELRVTLPAHGSLLAYGYLERPTAPGQISAAEMDARLRADCPAYAQRKTRPSP